ncbi:MAG: sulfurtransferase [Candidatus Rariloculaceae bacterium]
MNTSPLIDAETLATHIGEADWVVVDCRFQLTEPDAGFAAYREGHIPGARYAHLDNDLAAPIGPADGRHPLPDPDQLVKTLSRWGIGNDTQVVLYDDVSGAIAARLWWLLRWIGHERVAILDGGLNAWLAHREPLETKTPHSNSAEFSPAPPNSDWVVQSSELTGLIDSGAMLLDARSGERFRGEAEPIDPIAGHVPGARNLPFSALVTEKGTLLERDELRERFGQVLGRTEGNNVVAMCGSGVTACHLLFAMSAAGMTVGRLYAGSWSEWIRDNEHEIATGPN